MTISQLLKNIKINCPLNTVQIDVLRIKPTVLYDTNSVRRKHFSTKFTVQYKPIQAKLGELCPPPGAIPPCKDGNVRFIMVPLKALSDQVRFRAQKKKGLVF